MEPNPSLQSLAQSKREKNVEEEIPFVNEAVGQSDVMDHLEKETDNGSGKI